MSSLLISRSADLARLREEGFNLEARDGVLLVHDVPYVSSRKEVTRGTLVAKLTLAGDRTGKPEDHVAYFKGDHPCDAEGREIEKIKNASAPLQLTGGVIVDHTFSAKPKPAGNYEDYHAKVTTYVAIISGPARELDPTVSAQTFPPVVPDVEEHSVFAYIDTASTLAEITAVSAKLACGKIAIVGLGGTGSYVLDFIAKTPVTEIHLFDGDTFYTHNAFRAPGAAPLETLRGAPKKVTYYKDLYSQMHMGIAAHDVYLGEENLPTLEGMDFVFLCIDGGGAKKAIIAGLERFGIPFIDAGIGVDLTNGSLGGIVRVTTSTPPHRGHVPSRIPLADAEERNDYDRNIQIADLNALSAVLAVIKWKKLYGFYRDLDQEFHCTYTVDGNMLVNGDQAS